MLGTLFNIQPLQTVEDVVSEEFGYIFAEKVVSAIDFIYQLKYETALDILYNLPISDKSKFKELFDLFGELFIYNHTFNLIKFADIELKFEQFIDNLDTENENEIVLISICYIILADFYEKINSDKAIISVKAAGDWIGRVTTENLQLYDVYVIAKLAYYKQDYCSSIPAFNKCLIETNDEVYIDQIMIRLELVRAYFNNSQYEQGFSDLEIIDEARINHYPLLLGLFNLLYGLGLHYTNQGGEAHYYLQTAISVFETIDNKYLLAQTYQYIGMNDLDTLHIFIDYVSSWLLGLIICSYKSAISKDYSGILVNHLLYLRSDPLEIFQVISPRVDPHNRVVYQNQGR